MFSDFRRTNVGFLVDFIYETSFKLHDCNLAWGLPIHTRFDDLYLISRSQVCQNHKLQIGV